MQVLSAQVGDGESVGHPGLLPLEGGVNHLALPPPGDRGRGSPSKGRAGDDQGLAKPEGTQPPTNLPAAAVQDNRLLWWHVHCQVHSRYGGGLDFEIHPAPIHSPVPGFDPLDHKNPRTLVHLEKATVLQSGVVGPVSCI